MTDERGENSQKDESDNRSNMYFVVLKSYQVVFLPSLTAKDMQYNQRSLGFERHQADVACYNEWKLCLVDEQPRERERVGRAGAILRDDDSHRTIVKGDDVFVVSRFGDGKIRVTCKNVWIKQKFLLA